MNVEKISSLILSVFGAVIVVDTILQQFFGIGTQQDNLVLGYCIAFVLLPIKFPNLLKKNLVKIPMYIMIFQMIYSVFITYIL